jgi:hypothetical protein
MGGNELRIKTNIRNTKIRMKRSVMMIFIPAYIMYICFDASVRTLMTTIIAIYIITFPPLFRWSRNIWLNIFVKFDRKVKESHLHKIQTKE